MALPLSGSRALQTLLLCALALLVLIRSNDESTLAPPRPPPPPPSPPPPSPPPRSSSRLPAAKPRHVAAQLHRGAVVQAESRPPSNASAYWVHCVALNMRYAWRWRLDYLLYAPADATGETLAYRRRHVAWTRVPAIAHALFTLRYRSAIYLDSDAIFNRFDASVPSFLAAALADRQSDARKPLANPARAHAATLWNHPYPTREGKARPSHTGIMFFNGTEWAGHILARWWYGTCCGGRYDRPGQPGRDWDQGPWNEDVLATTALKRRVAILTEDCMNFLTKSGEKTQMWIHFAGKRVPKKEKALPMLTERLKALLKAEASVGTQGGEPPPLPPGDAGVRVAVERAAACLLANESAGAKQACARAGLGGGGGGARFRFFRIDTAAVATELLAPRRSAPKSTVFENNVDLHEAIKEKLSALWNDDDEDPAHLKTGHHT